MELAPIVLFVYNRPEHTCKTLSALQANKLASGSDLYVFVDGPKDNATADSIKSIDDVIEIVNNIKGFHSVKVSVSKRNKGLANSVISGVTEVIRMYGCVIVLEDDIVTQPYFLNYMNEALNFYKTDKRILSISGFNYPLNFPKGYAHDIYVSYRCDSWGWATWLDRWENVNWDINSYSIIKRPTKRKIRKFNKGGEDLYSMLCSQAIGKLDSWAIRWQHFFYENDGLCIYPIKSFVRNIGFDGSGVHCSCAIDFCSAPLYDSDKFEIKWESNIRPNKKILDMFYEYYRVTPKVPLFTQIKRSIKRIIGWNYLVKIVRRK